MRLVWYQWTRAFHDSADHFMTGDDALEMKEK